MNKPNTYVRVNHIQRRDVSAFADEFVDEIGEITGCCLDIGSGPGDTVVDIILPKFNEKARLVCSDISEKMVNFGKEKYKDNDRVSFLELNIEAPKLPRDLIEQFDHVTSFYCLHWCHDMRQAFQNIYNLLRPGGTAFVTFITQFRGYDAYMDMASMRPYEPYMKDAYRCMPAFQNSEQPQKDLKALIRDIGFQVRHCSVREKTYTFDNLDVMREFLLTVSPFIERIPDDLKEKFGKDLAEKVAARSIILKNNNDDEQHHSVLLIYNLFFGCISKPFTK